MSLLDKLVEIGFSLPDSKDISAFLSNIGYVAKYTEDDLVEGVEIPANRIFIFASADGVKTVFTPTSQAYKDLMSIFVQKNNTNPNRSRVNTVICYQMTETDYKAACEALFKVDANWAQLVIDSNADKDITDTADFAESNNRLFLAQTASADVSGKVAGNIALMMQSKSMTNTKLDFHDTSARLVSGLAGILATPMLGAMGDLYSTVSGIVPINHSDMIVANLDAQNVGYYSNVNPINGGGVDQYATPCLFGNKQIGGEITKRRYIRFTIDLLEKAKVIEFLKKKYNYEEASNVILEGMLKGVLISCQSNGLIVKDSEETKGFDLKTMPIATIRKKYPTDYSNQVYRAYGWYIDALTGTKVIIEFTVDPSDAEKDLASMM